MDLFHGVNGGGAPDLEVRRIAGDSIQGQSGRGRRGGRGGGRCSNRRGRGKASSQPGDADQGLQPGLTDSGSGGRATARGGGRGRRGRGAHSSHTMGGHCNSAASQRAPKGWTPPVIEPDRVSPVRLRPRTHPEEVTEVFEAADLSLVDNCDAMD